MRTVHHISWGEAAGQGALVMVVGVSAGWGPLGWLTCLLVVIAVQLCFAAGIVRRAGPGPGPADRVTMLRAVLTAGVAGCVTDGLGQPMVMGSLGDPRIAVLTVAAATGLVLDGVDGKVARRTGTVSALGARFDMEVDALLILVLSIQVALLAGWWVLAIGAARYLLFGATRLWPWLGNPSPPRFWCKVVAVVQGVVLTAAIPGWLPPSVMLGALVGALALLAESFGRQVLWLRTHRGPAWSPAPWPAWSPQPAPVPVPARVLPPTRALSP